MSFNVTLSIPINFNDNYVKKGGQAGNAAAPQPGGDDWLPPSPIRSPNPDANDNDNDTPNAEYVAQINNEFQPIYNLNGIRPPNDELMGGFLWNEYNWHHRNLLDHQLGYFHHDGNRPVQPTPVYPRLDRVDLPGFVAGFGGRGGGLMSSRTEANISRPRAEPARADPPRNRESTDPQPFEQRPRPHMKYSDNHFKVPNRGLGLRNLGRGDSAEHDHPLMSGMNPGPNFNQENEPMGGNAHCDAHSRGPIPTINPHSLDLKTLMDILRDELTVGIKDIFENFQSANIVSSPSSDDSPSLVDG
jgi:hypothetical protein